MIKFSYINTSSQSWKQICAFKVAVLFFFFLTNKPSSAKTYYFSSSSGNDQHTNVQAQNFTTPWKTLIKLNAVFTTLQAGDSVLFKRGDVFGGAINVTKSGLYTANLVFGAYGSNSAKPVISGFGTLNGWKSAGNGIYESDFSNEDVVNLSINGKQQAIGRYPNEGYLTYQSHQENSSITDSKASSAFNWTNAEVVIRKNRWTLDKSLITSHTSTTLNYATGNKAYPTNGYGYFIQKSKLALDKFGEWYFDATRKKMMVFFGQASPASYNVRASTSTTLVSIKGYHCITFENLTFLGAGTNGFHITGARNVSIKNCNIESSGHEAILASYSPFLKIEDSYISHSLSGGINLDAGCTDAVILNNKIKNTGLMAGLGKSGTGTYEAITSFGDHTQIEKNTIDSVGYNGIYFGGNGSIVKNNFITNFCLTKDDGAGIYVGDWQQTFNKKVIGNIVLNGVGNGAGTNYPKSLQAEGIYIDDLSQSVSVLNNTVAMCANNGIKNHNASDVTISNNVVYDNGVQLRLEQDHYITNSTYIRKNTISNNTFFSRDYTQPVVKISTHQDDVSLFGTLDSNAYCHPFDKIGGINTSVVRDGKAVNQTFSLFEWVNTSGNDKSSSKSPQDLPAFKVSKEIGTNKFPNQSFDKDVNGLYLYSTINDGESVFSKNGLDGGTLRLNFTKSANNQVTVNLLIGKIEQNKKYVLRFSMLGNLKEQSAKVFLRKTGVSYTILSNIENANLGAERVDHEMLFSSTTSADDASIIFEFDQPYGPIFIDNVALLEAEVSYTDPKDHFLFEYNANSTVKTLALSRAYVDVHDRPYLNEISIAPYSSILLIAKEADLSRLPQSIMFANMKNEVFNDEQIQVLPVSSSGLPITLKVASGPATIVDKDKVSFYATGTAVIEASQRGNEKYEGVTASASIINKGNSLTQELAEFKLKAFPNPFQTKLNIEFTMPFSGNGLLMLYDLQGREIQKLHDGFLQQGQLQSFVVDADALNLKAGNYLVRLSTEKKVLFQKVVLIK